MTAHGSRNVGPTHRAVESGVTLVIAVFGAIVVFGSIKAGINWGAEGPRAGFFPFYVGLIIIVSSAINLWNVLRDDHGGLFAEWSQLRQVFSVVIPTAIYVAAMPFTGLYLASMIFIAWFMRWLGNYKWPIVAAISLGMPIVTYVIFERWFLVPLPKGPIEEWLGL
ncbi:tripartite tricarboxylate transporter TctB family protein [Rhodopseudomonas sp. P2A-2r]|uniref:tripartite tricarboxylate transporter TctB family protein n=1 Tax=unclassified Rhodopseudomonas TaxID=2638247 RepID=UPI00223492B9|nr:tripartite tricarboxylate transporter TctB family protein [Rhodopseudomonas sp. P2A-2r]UZE47522.1 tripartite tricarboxylate transporter TctB family protein [Rhodopseudomonas sp. P2A-2r]